MEVKALLEKFPLPTLRNLVHIPSDKELTKEEYVETLSFG
jgi:hypothetical protein